MADSPSGLAAEIRKLEQKHADDPEGRYFVPLANAYRQLGELEHAELLLKDGLKRHPEYLSAHIVLGRCFLERGELPAAAEEFRHVLAVDPQNLIALRTLGELAVEQGHLAEAEQWYHELLAVDPLNEDGRRALEALQAAREEGELQGTGDREQGTGGTAGKREEESDSEAVPSAFRNPQSAWPEGEEVGFEEGEVVTETIAELYARQGVYERAAAVYRELLRRRGDTPELVARLRELERLAVAQRRGEGREAAALEPAAQDAEAKSAWRQAEQGQGEGARTIAEYLAELLAWRRVAAGPVPPPDLAGAFEWQPPADGLASSAVGDEYAAAAPAAPQPPSQCDDAAESTEEPSANAGEDDAELESFQTWLQSLKR